MNFTLSLLAGLILLLPGIGGLVSWNARGASEGARRPELQLTSVTALFLVLGLTLLMHLLGYALITLIWAALPEIGSRLPAASTSPLIDNPYEAALGLALGNKSLDPVSLAAFPAVSLIVTILAWRLVASPGLDIVTSNVDVRSQGWIFDHVVRPARHGYKPIAYVLTNPPQGEYGIGYEGVIADIRQAEGGELKVISLAEPQRFVYRIEPVPAEEPRRRPSLSISGREWVGGIVALDASVIRNVVVHVVSADLITEVEAEPDHVGEEGARPPYADEEGPA